MYTLVIEKRVYKDLDKIPSQDVDRIYHSIEQLEQNPRPIGHKKLKGFPNRFRSRCGDYRIVYIIDEAVKIVSILLVRHRKDVYKNM